MDCEATCHLDEELEQGQRRSPVSVMDFLSQDEEDDDGEVEDGNGNSEYDDVDDSIASPTFQQSLSNIRSKPFLLRHSICLQSEVISVDPYTMQFAKQSLLLFFKKKEKEKYAYTCFTPYECLSVLCNSNTTAFDRAI
jgi:hypothetical protein